MGTSFRKVRTAFLSLDDHHKGYLTIEDILKYLDGNIEVQYDDLKKLIKDKDTTNHDGQINYADFSKWIGPTIS